MAQGLQVWGADGALLLDIGDYSTRFLTGLNITLGAGQASVAVGVSGVTADKHFAAVTGGDMESSLRTEVTAIAGNGVVYLVSLTGSKSYARTAVVDVYAFS